MPSKRTTVPKKQFDNSPPPPKKKPKKPKKDKVVEGLKRAADGGEFDDLLDGGGKRRRRKKTGKKRKASAAFLKAGNDWRAHIKETMRKNPSMKFGKKLLKLASRTYKKGAKGVGISGGARKKRTNRRKSRSLLGF